jgi:predicted nucleic acid-binding protein
LPNKENHFDLLRSLFGELRIPTTVSKEVIVSGHGRASRPEVSTANRIHVCEVRDTTAVELLQERLDAGESEAIVPAIELCADLLLIDEARGRRVAESQRLEKTGTLYEDFHYER